MKTENIVFRNTKVYKTDIIGKIDLQIKDLKTGKIIRSIKKENTDTLIAKFNVPTANTLYADIILKSISDYYKQDFNNISKLTFFDLDKLRSGKISPSFSYDSGNKRYTANINFTNTDPNDVQVYGMLSFTNYNGSNVIMTILDLESENIIVENQQQLIGKYIIEYNQSTPVSEDDKDISVSEYEENSFLDNVKVSKQLRNYKYTRTFVQTGEWLGIHTDDVPQSNFRVTITSSNSLKKAYNNDSQELAEYYFNFTSDGSPDTVQAKKYLRKYIYDYNIDNYSSFYADSNNNNCIFYTWYKNINIIEFKFDNVKINENYYDFRYKIKVHDNIKLYSAKFNYPELNKNHSGTILLFDFLWTYYFYVYWSGSDKLKIFCGKEDNYNATVNGVYYIDDGGNSTQLTTDTDGNYILPANSGQGTIYIDTSDGNRIMLFHDNMYSYISCLPVSPTLNGTNNNILCGKNGNWGNLTDFIGQEYTTIFAKEENKDDDLGFIQGEAIVYSFDNIYVLSYSSNNYFPMPKHYCCPIYKNIGDGYIVINYNYKYLFEKHDKGVRFLHAFYNNDFLSKYHINTNKEIVNNTQDFIFFKLEPDICSINEMYENYNKIGDYNTDETIQYKKVLLSVYFDKNNNIIPSDLSTVIPETVNQTETIGNLTLQFTTDTVFKSGEYFKFPINDNDSYLLIDALETWKLSEISNKYYDNEFWEEYSKSNSIWIDENKDDNSDVLYFQPKQIEIKKPNFNILDSRGIVNTNKVAIYEIPLSKDKDVLHTLLLPMKIEESGNTYYVITNSIMVTDGMHIIDSEVSLYPDSIFSDNDIELIDKYYKIKLNSDTLNDIYGVGHDLQSITLYVYFEIKKKDDILPYEFDLYIVKDNDNLTEGIYRIELPFLIDGYIKVVDDYSNNLQFEIRKISGKELENDSDTGNILYIKYDLTQFKNDKFYFSFYHFSFEYENRKKLFLNTSKLMNITNSSSNLYQFRYTYSYYYIDLRGKTYFSFQVGNELILKTNNNILYFDKSLLKAQYNIFNKVKIKIESDTNNNNSTLLTKNTNVQTLNSHITKYKCNYSFDTNNMNLSDCFDTISDYYVKIYKYFNHKYNSSGTNWSSGNSDFVFNTGAKFKYLYSIYGGLSQFPNNIWNTSNEKIYYQSTYHFIKTINGIFHNKSFFKTHYINYYHYLKIEDVNNNILTLQRTKWFVSNNNVPIRTINIKENVKILTKYYKFPSDFTFYPNINIDDDEFPLSKNDEDYNLIVPFYNISYYTKYDNIYNNIRFLIQSDKIYDLLVNKNYGTSAFIGCVNDSFYEYADNINNGIEKLIEYESNITHNFIFKNSYEYFDYTSNYVNKTLNINNVSFPIYWDNKIYYSLQPFGVFYNIVESDYKQDKIIFSKNTSLNLHTSSEIYSLYKLNKEYELIKKSTKNYLTLLLSNEEIEIDKIDDFGKYSPEILTQDKSNKINYYSVIYLKNINTNEEFLFAVDKYQSIINIEKIYNTLVNENKEITNYDSIKYLLPNRLTFEDFNRILSTYQDGNGTYIIKYGLLIWSSDNVFYKIKGITISASFNDETLYNTIPYCYINDQTGLLSNDKTELLPDVSNKKFKVYIPEYKIYLDILVKDNNSIYTSMNNYNTYERNIIETGLVSVNIDNNELLVNSVNKNISFDANIFNSIFNSNDVIASYFFENNANDSTHDKHGTWHGSNESYVDSPFGGKCANFTTSGGINYITLPSLSFSDSWTIACWFKFNSNSNHTYTIFDFGNGRGVNNILIDYEWQSYKLRLYLRGPDYDTYITFNNATAWTFTSIVYNRKEKLLSWYVNDKIVKTKIIDIPPKTRNNNFIGNDNWGDEAHNMYIDNLFLFNKSLSNKELSLLRHIPNFYKIDFAQNISNNKNFVINSSLQNNNTVSTVIYVDLNKLNIDGNDFTNGVVVKDNTNNNIPTCYENIRNKFDDDFTKWNKKGIYTKIEGQPNSILEYSLADETNIYTIDDIFIVAENFENVDHIKNNFTFNYLPIELSDNVDNFIDEQYVTLSKPYEVKSKTTLGDNVYIEDEKVYLKFEDNLVDEYHKVAPVFYGNELYDNGIFDKCIKLDGNSYIDLRHKFNEYNKLTVSFWYCVPDYYNNSSSKGVIHFSKDDNNTFALYDKNDSTKFDFVFNNNVHTINDYIPLNRQKNIWYHIVIDTDGNFYINGQECNVSDSVSPTIFNRYGIIGADRDSSSINDYCQALIDDFRIYSRILSYEEKLMLTHMSSCYQERFILSNTDIKSYGSEKLLLSKTDFEPIKYDSNKKQLIFNLKNNDRYYIKTKNSIIDVLDKNAVVKYKYKTNNYNFRMHIGNFERKYCIKISNTEPVKRYYNNYYNEILEKSSRIWYSIPNNYFIVECSWLNKIRLSTEYLTDLEMVTYTPNKKTVYSKHGNIYEIINDSFGLWFSGGDSSNINEVILDYFYLDEYIDKKPVVLYEENLKIAIPENIATWFIIDKVNTISPDKDQIKNIIDNYDRYNFITIHIDNDEYDTWYWKFYDSYNINYDMLLSMIGVIYYRQY